MASSPEPRSPTSSPLAQMGSDQIVSILNLLPVDSILRFAMTCRRFRSIAASDSLWESICRKEWGGHRVDALVESLSSNELRWGRMYREVSRMDRLSCRRLLSEDGVAPMARASPSLSFIADCLVLFGGGSEGGRHLDDTWVAYIGNGLNRVPNWRQVSSGSPSGRFGQSCAVVGDALILFGGINDDGVRQNDTWVGHVTHKGGSHETEISWRPLDVGPVAPSPRGAHAACPAGCTRMVIHGGIGLSGLRLSDMWLLDLSDDFRTASWRLLSDAGVSPLARSGHSLTWINDTLIVLFGGRGSGYDVLNDVWILEIREGYPKWTELATSGEAPQPRVGHSATHILGGRILIYGGEDTARHRKDDFWVLDVSALARPSKKTWKKMRAEGQNPDYRSFHGACADRSGRKIFVFGGMVDEIAHPAEAYGLMFDGGLYLVELVLQL